MTLKEWLFHYLQLYSIPDEDKKRIYIAAINDPTMQNFDISWDDPVNNLPNQAHANLAFVVDQIIILWAKNHRPEAAYLKTLQAKMKQPAVPVSRGITAKSN